MPTTDVAPVTPSKYEPDQAPAVPLTVEPAPNDQLTLSPIPFVAPTQVHVVYPVMVTNFCYQVFADKMV